MAKQIEFTPLIENQLPRLVRYLGDNGGRVDYIPPSVCSIITIRYAQQEGIVRRDEKWFVLTGKGIK